MTLGENRQEKAKGGEGNTGTSPQPCRKTFYCFTLYPKQDTSNNLLEDLDLLKATVNRQLESICKKFFYGEEICPHTKRLHLQGFMALKKPMRITEIKLANNPRMEACKGTEEQNMTYCGKDQKVTKFGYPKEIKIITELRPYQQKIEKLCLTEPDDRSIYWFWEPVGNIGKSVFIKYMVVKYHATLCQGGKHSDIINLIFNTDMDKCSSVIFDIPRAHKGNISYSALECIKNGMVCNTKYETGVKVFNSPHVIIFANFPPENPELLSSDRWVIEEL